MTILPFLPNSEVSRLSEIARKLEAIALGSRWTGMPDAYSAGMAGDKILLERSLKQGELIAPPEEGEFDPPCLPYASFNWVSIREFLVENGYPVPTDEEEIQNCLRAIGDLIPLAFFWQVLASGDQFGNIFDAEQRAKRRGRPVKSSETTFAALIRAWTKTHSTLQEIDYGVVQEARVIVFRYVETGSGEPILMLFLAKPGRIRRLLGPGRVFSAARLRRLFFLLFAEQVEAILDRVKPSPIFSTEQKNERGFALRVGWSTEDWPAVMALRFALSLSEDFRLPRLCEYCGFPLSETTETGRHLRKDARLHPSCKEARKKANQRNQDRGGVSDAPSFSR